MEEEEAADEHEEGERAHREVEIAPAHVGVLRAARFAAGNGAAGGKGAAAAVSTTVVGEKAPGDQGAEELAEGPPYREQRKEVAVGEGEELEEERPIYRKVATNSHPESGVQSTSLDPGIGSTNSGTEDSSYEKRQVKSRTTTDDVGDCAPERCTQAQTQEQRERCEAHIRLADSILGRQRRQRQCDALKPEVVC